MALISCMRPHLEQRKVLRFPDCEQTVLQSKKPSEEMNTVSFILK